MLAALCVLASLALTGAGAQAQDEFQVRPAPQPTWTPLDKTAAAATAIEPSQATPPQQLKPLLEAHNEYRAKHDAGPLDWSQEAANSAEDFVARCDFGFDDPALQQDNFGQNLFLTTSSDVDAAVGAATRQWYNGVKSYNFSQPGFSFESGTFTQVVWVDSKRLGCAAKYCESLTDSSFESGTIVACRYSPPGNVQGDYRDNVLPLTDEADGVPPPPGPDGPDGDWDIDWLQGNYIRVQRDAVAVLTFKVKDDDDMKCLDGRQRVVDRVIISQNPIQCPAGNVKSSGRTTPGQWGLQPSPRDAVTGGEACNSRTKVTWYYFYTSPRGVNARKNRCHRVTVRLTDGTTHRLTMRFQ